MGLDPEIFGAPKDGPKDSDIFKDSAPAQAAPAAVASTPKLRTYKNWRGNEITVTPEVEKSLQNFKDNPWGSGVMKLAYELGGKVTDSTGSPALGAAVSVIPDAIQMAMGGEIGKGAAPVLDASGKWLMGTALKPSVKEMKSGKGAAAIQTMLDQGFNPTTGGVEAMKGKLSDLGEQVTNAISKSGATIDTHAVADFVPDAYRRFANGPQAVQAIQDLAKVQTDLLEHPNVLGARQIPVQVAQDMKTGYQKAVGDKGYDQLKTAATEGEKQVARGFREKIGEAVPSVVAPLAEESSIINALKIAERTAAVDARKNPIGIGWLGQPWMIPYWMWDRSALAKSLTARALYSGQEGIPGIMGAAGGALHGAMQNKE